MGLCQESTVQREKRAVGGFGDLKTVLLATGIPALVLLNWRGSRMFLFWCTLFCNLGKELG